MSIAFHVIVALLDQPLAVILLPGAFGYFCLGALIAYAELFDPALDKSFRKWFGNPWAVGAATLLILLTLRTVGLLHDLCEAAFSFCLIVAARTSPQGWYLEWLAWPVMRHIGKISYGLYVYHPFVRSGLAHYRWDVILRHSIGGAPLKLSVETGLSFLFAELSWWFVERPISKLRPLVTAVRTC